MSERKKKSSIAGKIFLIILPLLVIAWLLLYTVVFTLAVRKQVRTWQSVRSNSADTLTYSPEEWSLIREKSFLGARIALASDDSIAMTINLRDSLVQIETKGVILRQVRFDRAEVSRFFSSFSPDVYTAIFSKPFNITEIEGTIVKEPITVKKAPRDSTEAAQNITKVDTTRIELVEWHLQLDSTFIISFVQSDQRKGGIDWPTAKYRFRQHYKTLIENNRKMFSLKLPVFHPEITIFIPGKEAKSFYRALPPNGQVALRF